jgi:monoamine oxidase
MGFCTILLKVLQVVLPGVLVLLSTVAPKIMTKESNNPHLQNDEMAASAAASKYASSLFVSALSPSVSSSKKVIVIGAGFSGLSVAYHLQQQQAKEQKWHVELVEARDRVGGRVHTVPFGKNSNNNNEDCSWIDLGGQWIHEANDRTNPLVRLIRDDLGLGPLEPNYHTTNADDSSSSHPRRSRRRFNVLFSSQTGREIPKALFKDATRYFYKGINDFEWEEVNSHTSFQELLSDKWKELTQRKRSKGRALLPLSPDEEEESPNNDKNKKHALYEHVDWDRLPSHVREAAKLLGYDETLWDNDEDDDDDDRSVLVAPPPASDKDWLQLAPDEQRAAQTLGYTKQMWDEEEEVDNGTLTPLSGMEDHTPEEAAELLACAWNYLRHRSECYEGGRMEELSAWLSELYQNRGGPDKLPPKGGYGRVLDTLVERLTEDKGATTNIRLHSPVKTIRYNPSLKEDDATSDDDSIGSRPSGVEVCLVDGSLLQAEYCVCTIPLGVLQDETIEFEPPLPKSHRMAIQSIGMGILNKIVLQFDDSFWGDLGQFGIADSKDPTLTKSFLDCSPDPDESNTPKILILFLGGNAARRIDPYDSDNQNDSTTDSLSDEQAVADAMNSLRLVFGNTIPDPVATKVTRWGSDPFSRGGYSFAKVGCEASVYDDVAQPLGNLFFAGEHTSKDAHSTVHGAWMTGSREAKRLLQEPRFSPSDL